MYHYAHFISGIDICARLNQQLHYFSMIFNSSQMKWSSFILYGIQEKVTIRGNFNAYIRTLVSTALTFAPKLINSFITSRLPSNAAV